MKSILLSRRRGISAKVASSGTPVINFPSGLSVSLSGSTATLYWTNNAGSSAQTSIEHSLNGTSGWAEALLTSAAAQTADITGLTAGPHYFRLRSKVGTDYSSYAVQTLSVVVVFNVANFAASVSGTTVNLSWDAHNAGLAQTVIERSSNSGATWSVLITVAAGASTYSNTGLSAGSYLYRARGLIGSTYSASYTSTASATVAGSWQLPTGHFEPSRFAMEIIAPRAGLSTTNRYYKQYPGIPYRVPVSVFGGAWPFKYELTAAPSGMTIGQYYGDTDYGIINWANPVTTGSPHTVSVKVTDQEGTVRTVTFTITVTTSGFLFIDAVNGNDANPGTLASPKKTINGWYIAYSDTSYQNYFIYYKTGTYPIADANDPVGKTLDDGAGHLTPYTRCYGARKPYVHLAYPGHTPIFDANGAGFVYDAGSGAAPVMIGIGGTGVGSGNSRGLLWWDAAPDAVVFENNIGSTAAGVASTNASIFMARRGTTSSYQSIIGNTFNGVNGHDLFLAYTTNKTVAENNDINNYTGGGLGGTGHGFFFKETNTNASVRNNHGLTGNAAELVHITMSAATFNNVEVCWNNYKSTLPALLIGPNVTSPLTGFEDYRNTWQVPYNLITLVYAGTMTGSWNSQKNVIVHNGTDASGIFIDTSEGGGANWAGTLTENNLEGTSSERSVNSATGAMTGADLASYGGRYGHGVS